MKLFRRKAPQHHIPVDTRRVNLTELGQSHHTLSSRIDWPDTYRPLDPIFAVTPVDDDPVIPETFRLADSAAPYVDEFTADALNGWLDEHLPGWSSRTDYEMRRRLDVQRTLIAEITQNYALLAARIGHQRAVVQQLDAVVDAADRVLAGLADSLGDPADQTAASPTAAAPLALPALAAFGHPDLAGPGWDPAHDFARQPQSFSIVHQNPGGDGEDGADTEGEVA